MTCWSPRMIHMLTVLSSLTMCATDATVRDSVYAIIPMPWWLMMMVVWSVGNVTARESRKEANLLPVPVGVNLLDGATTENHGHVQQSQEQHGVEDGDIVIDYDYFMHGSRQEDDHDPYFGLDQVYQTPETSSSRSPYSAAPSGTDDVVFQDYNYQDDDHSYNNGQGKHDSIRDYRNKPNTPSHASLVHHQETEDPMHDPFSVFYDSLFPEMDSVIPIKETETIAENMPLGLPPTTTASAGTTVVHHAGHPSPTTTPRHTSPPADHTPTQPVVTTTHPFSLADSLHLKAMMPAFLEKFGIPESLVNQLFQNESMLGRTLIQMTEDETFREVMSIISELDLSSLDLASLPLISKLDISSLDLASLPFISELDLSNLDLASLPRLLNKTDSSLVTTILQGTNLTRVTDIIKSLGLDSYLPGVFSRAGAAAQYKYPAGDGSKSVFLPLVSTGNLATVQLLGFVLLVVGLLAATYAYLGYDIFDTARKDKYAASRKQLVTPQAPMGWGDNDHKWLQAVDAAEISPHKWQEQWPGSRPSYQEESQTHHAEHRPPQPHRVPRPRPTRPEANRHHLPQERPAPPGLLTIESQSLHRHTNKQPTIAPYPSAEHVDHRHYSSYEDDQLYHDQHTDEGDNYSEDYYYHEPSQDADASAVRHVPQHYVTTQKPKNDDYYTFYVPPVTPSTRRPPTRATPSSTTTTKRAVTTTTTTSPQTRPTSKYVGTIRSQHKITRKRPIRPTTTTR